MAASEAKEVKAAQGEKMIEAKVRFWTDGIAEGKGKVVPGECWDMGVVLLAFPTLIFHQCPLSTFTLRQASRRSWRIGQVESVKVFYLAYAETLQDRLLSLMASKITASSALEGSFSEDGLAALAGGEDLTTELARTLAENIRLEDVGRAWAKVSAKKPKAAKPETEPRIDPFRQPATSPKKTVRRRRSRRAARVVALPTFA